MSNKSKLKKPEKSGQKSSAQGNKMPGGPLPKTMMPPPFAPTASKGRNGIGKKSGIPPLKSKGLGKGKNKKSQEEVTHRVGAPLVGPGMTENSYGPNAYVSHTPKTVEAGAALMNAEWENGASIDAFYANAEAGFGNGTYGAAGEVGMFEMNSPQDFPIGGGFGFLQAEAAALINDERASFGATADAANAHARLGSISADSNTDSQFLLGAGAGVGASGSLLYGDSDNDGYREFGFEVSGALGIEGTLGYKSEDPIRDLMGVSGMFLPADYNVTHDMWERGVGLAEGIGEGWQNFSDWAGW